VYVCVCMAVTEEQIHEAARRGARTLKDLQRDLGVASECGTCASHAQQCLAEAREAPRKAGKAKPPAGNSGTSPPDAGKGGSGRLSGEAVIAGCVVEERYAAGPGFSCRSAAEAAGQQR
jgi:bacterioferritin-associated ferredoxin